MNSVIRNKLAIPENVMHCLSQRPSKETFKIKKYQYERFQGFLAKHRTAIFRNSRPEVFCRKGAHRNFTKFKRKHLCQSLFFNKVPGLIKKETLVQVLSCEFCEIPKITFLQRTPLVAASVFCKTSSTLQYTNQHIDA